MNDEHTYSVSDEEWERRRLCSDENCIGVIGPDGRCKECGKPYQGNDFRPDDGPAADSESTRPQEPSTSEPEAVEESPDTESVKEVDRDQEWANRRLCSDGNCIGVIGPDGRCKECGKPYDS